jgi:uncharacterized membrane protein
MTEAPPGRARPGRLWTALVASLGLNLFLAGWWVGAVLRPWPPAPPPGPLHMLSQRLAGRLSPAAFREVSALIDAIGERLVRQIEDGAPLRGRLRAILVADVFDAAAFVATLDELTAARTRNDGDISRRIAAVVAGLSAADRAVLADVALASPAGLFGGAPGPLPPPPPPPRG